MKELYKNPILYYVAAPLLLALWPVMLVTMYLPRSAQNLKYEQDQYKKAQALMDAILELDPGRLELSDANNVAVEFDYATAVDKIATTCGIAPANYTLSSRPIVASRDQKSQSAQIIIHEIDVARLSEFVSALLVRWANLQCTDVKLTKIQGSPDAWKANLNFKYYF